MPNRSRTLPALKQGVATPLTFRTSDSQRPDDARSQIQVIARAASILRALEDEDEGLSLGRIAGQTGLPRSTVQRIVAALESEKLVISASAVGGWRLGPALTRLASSVNVAVTALTRPLIVELSAELQETVDLSIPKKNQVIFIDQVIGSQRLRTVSAVGEGFPVHCTANGKAYLAALPDDEIVRRIGRHYPASTPNTRHSFDLLRSDLAKVRRMGYSLDREEHTLGISAAGILVTDALCDPLLVSIPVPTSRFESKQRLIVEKILEFKLKLQKQLDSVRHPTGK